MFNKQILSLVFAALALSACGKDDDDLPGKIEKAFSRTGVAVIRLGAADIRSGNHMGENSAVMSEYEYEIVGDMQKAALLNITKNVNLRDNNFHGFNAAFASSQRNVVRQIDTALTPLGKTKLSGIIDRDSNTLNLRLCTVKISKIDRTKDIDNKNSDFRYVAAYAACEPTEEARMLGGKYAEVDELYIQSLFRKRKIDDSYELVESSLGSGDDKFPGVIDLREKSLSRLELLVEKQSD